MCPALGCFSIYNHPDFRLSSVVVFWEIYTFMAATDSLMETWRISSVFGDTTEVRAVLEHCPGQVTKQRPEERRGSFKHSRVRK